MKLHAEEVCSQVFLWSTLMQLERVMILEYYSGASIIQSN